MKLTRFLRRNLAKLMDNHAADKLTQYSKFSPSPVSIRHFLEYGRTASAETSYLFLRKEIPVRLANIMKELELLPEVLLQQLPCCQIQDFYVQSFHDVLCFESASNTPKDHDAFAETLKDIRLRHIDTVPMMADAISQMKQSLNEQVTSDTEARIQYFLNRLYMSRISIHMLIHQHALMFNEIENRKQPDHVGCIDPNCNVLEIVEDAYASASFVCEQHYMASVENRIKVINSVEHEDCDHVTFSYVPAHLHYMLFELLKNALRATIETHQETTDTFPKIDILIIKSPHDITIRISDQGGGIPWNETEFLFQYMYTTAPSPDYLGSITPMAGLGYGLPLSRLYARYFHGDIVLTSMDGYGTDVTIYLRALSEEASEFLPVYNNLTRLFYEKPRPLSCDWTDPTASLGFPNVAATSRARYQR